MDTLKTGTDVFFILIGAILVFAMHAGFAFLEVGTVRKKNQVNALVKIIADFAISTVVYFFIGYNIAYGVSFLGNAADISGISENSLFLGNGYDLVKFFFLLTFAAAIPAIISGGIAERSRFKPQLLATAIIVGLIYPLYEGMVWGGLFDFQSFIADNFGAPFHDFAGSIVVHAMGGWLALGAVVTLGARMGRYRKDGTPLGIPPSNIPFLALGSWILCIGWFGFNVMSAQTVSAASGLVALNSLMAMVGGILSALIVGKKDPGFVHNGALAGLVAVCAGSDLMHPIGALFVGIVAGVIFVYAFTICGNRWKIDDVLGVWPLHGLCGLWGGIAAGIFGQQALWGLGGVSLMAQIAGSLVGIIIAGISGFVVFGLIKKTVGFRLSQEDEYLGADLAIHNISATPEEDFGLR
ncbi:MAG: ammonium transporter [Alphaproteobacteria bacterium]|nr:ammonium transporter [Alphaproteobacteria bacterium]HPF47486.1 ammonium transporter [Emcibacteraceae bacterium]